MIVVDANILVALAIPGQRNESADRVFAKDSGWIGPPILISEFRNALATSFRKRMLDLETALSVMDQVEEFMADRELPVSSDAVLRLAARSGCTAYDCEYVALAMDLKIPLLTRDREVLAAFPKVALTPEAFLRK